MGDDTVTHPYSVHWLSTTRINLLQYTDFIVKLRDQGVNLGNKFLDVDPVLVIPLRHDLLVGLALLLHPGEVLQVVHTALVSVAQLKQVVRCQTQYVALVRHGRITVGIIAEFSMHLLQAALIQLHRIREDRQDDVLWTEFVVLGELNRHGQIGNAGKTE